MNYKPLTEAEVLAVLAEGELDASDLLYTANPNFEKKFEKLTNGLETLMKDVRKYFPDANYYSANDGIILLLVAPMAIMANLNKNLKLPTVV